MPRRQQRPGGSQRDYTDETRSSVHNVAGHTMYTTIHDMKIPQLFNKKEMQSRIAGLYFIY